jgi:ferritin
MQDAINAQIKAELDSAYLYLSMAAYFESSNLPGFARWMHVQSKEEVSHAMKFYNFILERGGQVILKALEQPESRFASVMDVFDRTLNHEQKVTGLITALYELALKEKDYPAQILLQWYIDEQVEEEANASRILEMLRMAEGKSYALLPLDHEMGKRGAEED